MEPLAHGRHLSRHPVVRPIGGAEAEELRPGDKPSFQTCEHSVRFDPITGTYYHRGFELTLPPGWLLTEALNEIDYIRSRRA